MSQSLTPRSYAAYPKLKALREAGYTGPVDQDGYPVPAEIHRYYPARLWSIMSRVAALAALVAAITALAGVIARDVATVAIAAAVALLMYVLALFARSQVDTIDNRHLVGEYVEVR